LNEQEMKLAKMREAAAMTKITIQVPLLKYRRLMELAHKTGTESLKFFKGEKYIDCAECPIKDKYSFCRERNKDDPIKYVITELACYGAFMKFLFSEV